MDYQQPAISLGSKHKTHLVAVTGVTSLHSRSVLGRDSNKGLSSIQAKGTSKGCERSVVD